VGGPKVPSVNEVDYFKRLEIKRLRAAAEAKRHVVTERELSQRKELHWMHCPKCGADLETVEMHGFQVDTCAHCHGLWLDAGELEGILAHEDHGLMGHIMSLFRASHDVATPPPSAEQP